MDRAASLFAGLICVGALVGGASCKGAASDGGQAGPAASTSAAASATASASAAPSVSATAAAPAATPVFVAGETWSGSFHCVRGQFQMSLHITRSQPDVGGTLSFTAPGGQQGEYAVSGVYDPGGRHLHLAPGSWIKQPAPGWDTMPMDGEATADGHGFSGVVQSSRCSGFAAKR